MISTASTFMKLQENRREELINSKVHPDQHRKLLRRHFDNEAFLSWRWYLQDVYTALNSALEDVSRNNHNSNLACSIPRI